MKLLAALSRLAVPAPEYSAAMQRAQLVDATWIARDGVPGLVIGCQDIRNAERLEAYREKQRAQEIARDRDFLPNPGVKRMVHSRAQFGSRRLVPVVVHALPGITPMAQPNVIALHDSREEGGRS